MPITKIKHKGLDELYRTGRSRRVKPSHQKVALEIMDFLNAIGDLSDCRGVKDFHPLKGGRKGEYAMHVNGNWVIAFTYDDGNVVINNLEDCH